MGANGSKISAEKESFRLERKFFLKWKIHDFVCKHVKAGEVLPSTKYPFSYNDINFDLQLYLDGDTCVERQCKIEITSSSRDNWKVWVELGLGDLMSGNYCAALSKYYNTATWNLFSNGTCILSKYLSNNAIKLTCTITYVTYTEDKSLATAAFNDYDTADLFETKVNSDVTFVVEENEIQAHKSVLEKRCKAFATMFEDNESNKIALSDIRMEVLQELLRFIYTGKKDVKVTLDLLAASDKYDLPDLKTICEKELSSEVSTETVARTLIYADLYKVPYLKEYSIKYIQDNLVAVTETEGWLKLVNNYNYLLAEIWK